MGADSILDYAVPIAPKPGRKWFGAAVLIAGAGIYLPLCLPAIKQYGYLPIEHFWEAMTYLWIAPLLLFCLVCPAGAFSKWAVMFYALATGYIDGCTFHPMNPRPPISELGPMNFILWGPWHIVLAAALVGIGRFIFRRLGVAPERIDSTQRYSRRNGIGLAIVMIAAAFPFGFRVGMDALDNWSGRRSAEIDWANHDALQFQDGTIGIWSTRQVGDYTIESAFDPTNGLRIRTEFHFAYESPYKQRVAELLHQNGIPSWSMKRRFVADSDLIAMLKDKNMKPVRQFPYDVTPEVAIARGTYSRWGGTTGNGSGAPFLVCKNGGDLGYDFANETPYVGKNPKYPGITFVRAGQQWVAACTDDGYIVEYAGKSQ